MSGLVVQTGPWKKSKTNIGRDKAWSGGGVPTGGTLHAGHGNWRSVMTPSQMSGFTYDTGFDKPSPYAIPSIVQKRLKQPTQKIAKEKVNYLKIIATSLQEQKDLAMKQAGYGPPTAPVLPQPLPSNEVRGLGQSVPTIPDLLQVSPTVSEQSADPAVFPLAAAESIPSMVGGFFNSALFNMGLTDYQHQPNKVTQNKTPKTIGLRPPSASEIQNALGNLRGAPSPKGFQPAANPFLTELKAKAEIVQNRQGSMDTDDPKKELAKQDRLAVLLKNYMDSVTAHGTPVTTAPSSRKSSVSDRSSTISGRSVSTTDLQKRLAEHLNSPQWVTNPVYDKTPIGIIGGGKITKNETPAEILRKTFTAEASASKRYGK